MLINKLRHTDSADVFGPKYWFLTLDRSLRSVEQKFFGKETICRSISADQWIQILTPLLSPEHTKEAREAFLDFFSSRLPMSTNIIDEDDFLLLQGSWIDDEDLKGEDIANVLGNKWLRSYLTEVREADRTITEEDIDKALKPVILQIKETKEKIATLEDRVFELTEDKNNLQTTVNKYQSFYEQTKRLIGALTFFGTWWIVYNILINTLEPKQSFIGSILISLIFGYLAGFKGYRWILERMLSLKEKKDR